jgi:hypothetical protein
LYTGGARRSVMQPNVVSGTSGIQINGGSGSDCRQQQRDKSSPQLENQVTHTSKQNTHFQQRGTQLMAEVQDGLFQTFIH